MQAVVSEAFETMPEGRYNWQHLMLNAKCRYRVFKKQTTIDCLTRAFKEVEERFGFRIRHWGIGDGLNHVHMVVAVPPTFTMAQVIQIFKCYSASKIFAEHPNFRKRYPRGQFWSDYRYSGSVGPMTEPTVKNYIQRQDARQQKLVQYQ